MRPTLPSSVLSRLSDLLAMRMCLHFPQERWGDLERGVAAAARALGMPDVETYAHRLLCAPLARGQIELLASHLTVGETFFFRDEPCFSALEEHVLPELLRKHMQGEHRLRIWCAGCCTGEEAYSIAMLLDRLIARSGDWNATVLATDINPAFLRKAADGVYGPWSFRNPPDWVQPNYFRRRRDSRFEIRPFLRELVSFSYLNLADEVYPSPVNDTQAMDLIVCRNVLMYFTAAQARKVVGNLHRSLAPGGWLIVSPAEASNILFSGYEAVEFSGVVFYRKQPAVKSTEVSSARFAVEADQSGECLHWERLPGTGAPSVPLHDAAPDRGDSAAPSEEPPPLAAATDRQQARIHANQGRLAEAAECCRKAIAADRLDPAPQYLLATIQQELGQSELAMLSLTRTLYLDPGFALAHVALGNLCLACGRSREAERRFRNALELLLERPQHEAIPESDGLSAGRLVEMLASVLSSLSLEETAGT